MNKSNLIIVFSFFISTECLAFGIFDCPGPECPLIGGELTYAVEKAGQDIGKTVEKAGQDIGKTVEKAGQDIGKTVEKAGQDIGKTAEKAVQDIGKTAEKAVQDIGKTAEKAVHETAVTLENSSTSFLCTYGKLTRTIVVDSPSKHSDYACSVLYESEKGISMPWHAKHQEAYCLPKALEFVALQETWGWSCGNN
jgi:vacuolar-type H+-ATPase subunit H